MNKKYSYAVVSLLIILLAVGITVLANICAAVGTDRLGLKFDLTANKLYELSDETKGIVAALPEPVTITVFNTQEDFLPLLKELFLRYDLAGDRLTVRYVDPYQDPNLVDYYKQKGFEMALGSVAVEGKSGRTKVLQTADFYEIDSDTNTVKSLVAEQQMTSALLYVTNPEAPLVQFTDGHNEQPSASLMKLFEQNNYLVKRTTLSVMGIDSSAKILVIASPVRDFSADEITQLDAFLSRGGRLMVFLEPPSDGFEHLKAFLAEWGIEITDGIVLEKELFSGGNPLNIAPVYAPHPINQYFSCNRYYPVMPSSHALKQLYQHEGNISTQPVLYSSGDSYAKEGVMTDTAFLPGDTPGPFPLALTAEKNLPGESGKARIFAAGCRDFYADDLMAVQSYANADFLVQVINWCADTGSGISIPAKSLQSEPIPIMTNQAVLLSFVLVILVPLAILGVGIAVYLRRRHL